MLLTPARFGIDQNEYIDGGPDVVIEIHSPGDETYEKLDFYAKVGVREVWIIDRDSKQSEIFELVDGEYGSRKADANGWFLSEVVGVEFRAASDGKLEIRLINRPDTAARLP